MAVTAILSNRFKYMRDTGEVDLSSDVFKIILMNTTFAFDPDSHSTLSDVTASQLATGNGYTQNYEILAGVAVVEDDINDRCNTTWNDHTIIASGGSIGPTGSAIIYDDTVTEDTVVGCVDFDEDITAVDGVSIQLQNIILNSN